MITLLLASLLLIDPIPVAMPRVRPISDVARSLVAVASSRSATVRALVSELEQSDVFVYVDVTHGSGEARAETVLLAANNAGRFLRVSIDARLEPRRRIELLGHELRHALEIARAPQVRDSATMRRLFREIGWSLGHPAAFETGAAVDTERQVGRELSARSRSRD